VASESPLSSWKFCARPRLTFGRSTTDSAGAWPPTAPPRSSLKARARADAPAPCDCVPRPATACRALRLRAAPCDCVPRPATACRALHSCPSGSVCARRLGGRPVSERLEQSPLSPSSCALWPGADHSVLRERPPPHVLCPVSARPLGVCAARSSSLSGQGLGFSLPCCHLTLPTPLNKRRDDEHYRCVALVRAVPTASAWRPLLDPHHLFPSLRLAASQPGLPSSLW
jgi:hypothetical protein